MTKRKVLPKKIRNLIRDLVKKYEKNRHIFESVIETLASDILKDPNLGPLVHSVKYRTKSTKSLKAKLERKAIAALNASKTFEISVDNFFEEITDLGGVRLLHLYPKQMNEIKPLLEGLLEEKNFKTKERIAYTWDEEYKLIFKSLGYRTKFKPSMYTSLHHVVVANTKNKISCEIQVRTLMEEVWGEVDHTINYPVPLNSVACKEQLKVLARLSSAGTRLADSIFASYLEHKLARKKSGRRTSRK